MGVVGIILLVAFVIVCVLLVLMVLVQNENSNGMGSAFGGGQSAAFGSHSASVLTKTTGVFTGLFFVLAFSLALVNRVPSGDGGMGAAAKEVQGEVQETEQKAGSWLDDVETTIKSAESEAPENQ